MTPPRRFYGLTTVPDAGPTGRRLTRRGLGTINMPHESEKWL
jgi:hypothetical protein